MSSVVRGLEVYLEIALRAVMAVTTPSRVHFTSVEPSRIVEPGMEIDGWQTW